MEEENLKSKETNILIDKKYLTIKGQIASGSFGRVFIGQISTKIGLLTLRKTVAIKEKYLRSNESLDELNKKIRIEIGEISTLKHPNVIAILGICQIANQISLIVMEHAAGGCLFNFLNESTDKLPTQVVLNWSLQIARGMNYIHSKGFLHCDLKAKNILLNIFPLNLQLMLQGTTLKIANISHFSQVFTPTHMAPEVMRNIRTKKSDVWSYGVVLWEIISRKVPFKGLEPMQIMYKVGLKKETLDFNEITDQEFKKFIKICWSYDHNERYSFFQIINQLLKIQNKLINQSFD